MLPSGKFPRFALLAALLAVLLFIYDLTFVHSSFLRLFLSNSMDAFVVALAALCSFYVAFHSSGYVRQVWLLLAIALTLETIGQGLTTYYQSFLTGSSLGPLPSDIFFFVWAAPVFMILLPPGDDRASGFDYLRLLDFLQIAIVAIAIYLYFFYFSSAWLSDRFSLLRGMLLLYIARDLFLSVTFFFRGRSSRHPWLHKFSMVLAMAFAAAVASDADYCFDLTSTISAATWGDLLWMLPSFIIIGFAAFWKPDEADSTPYSSTRTAAFFNAQLFPILMPLLVIFMARVISREHTFLAWIIIATSVLCSSIRLIFTNRRQRRITEDLLNTEKALLRSEQLLSTAFRASPDGFAINILPNGPFIDVNDSFTRLTGYTREEVINKTPMDINLWTQPARRGEILGCIAREGEVHDIEFQFRTKDGRIRTGELSGSLVNLDGRPCAVTAVRDVTERKASEELLRTTEQRFRALVDHLHVGIITYDPQGRMTFANQAALDFVGVTLEQSVGKTPAEVGLVAFREDGTRLPDSARAVPTVLSTRQPVLGQALCYRSPNRPDMLWTIIDAVPEFDSAGNLLRVVVSITDLTEQRRATQALRESEERFRSFIENLHVGIVFCNSEARILYANPAALSMFDMRVDQVTGKTEVELNLEVLREDGSILPASEGLVPTVVSTGRPLHSLVVGWRHVHTGKTIWTLLDAVPQCNAQGEVTEILISLTDLTEQRRATEALRESEERFRALVTDLHSAVVLHGLDGRVEYANPALLRMFNIPHESDIVGKLPSELNIVTLAEDGRPMTNEERPITSVLRTQTPVRNLLVGFRHPRADKPLWVLGSSAPRFDATGKIIGVITSFADLTEQRQATDALRESEERFRTLVRDLHVAVVLHNPDASIQFANKAALDMMGLPFEEVRGKHPWTLGFTAIDIDGRSIPPDDLPVPTVIRTKLPLFNQVMAWRRTGSPDVIWIYGNAVPQFAPDGSLLRVISSFSDITEMKNAERSIHQLSTELLKLQDEERRRIGRELHDGMAQTVLAVNLSLAQIRQSAQPLSEASTRALDKARELLQQMSREIRTLSYLLHPPLLDDLGLVTALKEYVNGFGERCGIETSLEVAPRFRRLPQIVETAFFRITQESLANIQRHSGSKAAKVSLWEDTQSVTLEITDYGHGMVVPENGEKRRSAPRLGVGIPGMRERMAQLGGNLEIDSNSHGTTVRARILLSASALKETPHDESTPAYRG